MPEGFERAAGRSTGATVLLVLAHPTFERSISNRRLLDAAGADTRATLHDLYERYPDFTINVAREQKAILAHETILLQFPLYWYAPPALLKEWIDLVFLHGFAFGDGARLAGRTLACAVTTGQDATGYAEAPGTAMTELLRPLERTASFCGMRWATPFVSHGAANDAGEEGGDAARYAAFVAMLARGDAP